MVAVAMTALLGADDEVDALAILLFF